MASKTFTQSEVSTIAVALKFYSEHAFTNIPTAPISPERERIEAFRREVWTLRSEIDTWWNRLPSSAEAQPVEHPCPTHGAFGNGAHVECPGCVAVIRARNLAAREA
jgi:hypothetical protein